MLLKPIGTGQGYLKAGFLGFQGSGKTFTAVKLAVGTRKYFNLPGPIAMFDTESGSDYVSNTVKKETGKDLLGVKSRSFTDLVQFGQECLTSGVSVAIIDSITHPWRELCDAYLGQLNEKRRQGNKAPLLKLEFQHWNAVKGQWQKWPDFYLNSALHIIICGRAGFEYEMETNDEGRKELIKTGVKMRVETEFGFEPSLLVEMEREQEQDANGTWHLKRRATVIKDRFGVVDGKTMMNPDFNFFLPHVKLLTPGASAPVDTSIKTDTGADDVGDDAWQRERRQRAILSEEIQGELVAAIPGQSAEEKKRKAELLYTVFATRSWTAIENMPSEKLRDGLEQIRAILRPESPAGEATGNAPTKSADGNSLVPAGDLPTVDDWRTRYEACAGRGAFNSLELELAKVWEKYSNEERVAMKMFRDKMKTSLPLV